MNIGKNIKSGFENYVIFLCVFQIYDFISLLKIFFVFLYNPATKGKNRNSKYARHEPLVLSRGAIS